MCYYVVKKYLERTLLLFFYTEGFAQNQQNLSTLSKPSVTITSPGSPGTIHTHPYVQQNCGKMQVGLGSSLCVCEKTLTDPLSNT